MSDQIARVAVHHHRIGRPIAGSAPMSRRGPNGATLLEEWGKLPAVDPEWLRRDIDGLIDPMP